MNWRTAMCEDIADEEEEGEVKVEEEVEGAEAVGTEVIGEKVK